MPVHAPHLHMLISVMQLSILLMMIQSERTKMTVGGEIEEERTTTAIDSRY